jgi:hypothetical protein
MISNPFNIDAVVLTTAFGFVTFYLNKESLEKSITIGCFVFFAVKFEEVLDIHGSVMTSENYFYFEGDFDKSMVVLRVVNICVVKIEKCVTFMSESSCETWKYHYCLFYIKLYLILFI